MLERLNIKNFALIEEVSLDFCDNLNILTGETGAGKSIVIDSVSILLGGRAQAEAIRTGAEKAYLEGVFAVKPGQPVLSVLEQQGIETEDDLLIMARELSKTGRHSCWVNGRTLPLSQYKKIGLALVDIHGQHDHQALLQSEKHLEILDRFGGTEHLTLLNTLKKHYESWQAAKRELEGILAREQERLQRIDFLEYQLKEIEQANLKKGELAELSREANVLANAEKIVSNLNVAYQQLFSGERGASAYDLLGKALAGLQEIRKYDPALEQIIEQLQPVLYQLEDSSAEIRNYLEQIEFSPERLEQVERRWQLLKDLCKKYGPEEDDVLAYAEKARRELAQWEKSTERASELTQLVRSLEEEYISLAREVSQYRREIARILEEKVTAELVDLAMPHVKFAVSFEKAEPTAKGIDRVEFLISPNPGEPLLPVAKIASGGELSRIILALKTIIAHLDGIGTLIFDEIDAGVGGKAAQKLAEKLETISKYQQVICVTHSPLIAALADQHIHIEKETSQDRTRTKVRILNEEERLNELVRMLGGDKPTEDLKRHARQIIKKS